MTDSESFKHKPKITGITPATGNAKQSNKRTIKLTRMNITHKYQCRLKKVI